MSRREIPVKNAFEKMEYTKLRLKKFSNWDAPNELKKLKNHCIAILCHRLIFLESHGIKLNAQNYNEHIT